MFNEYPKSFIKSDLIKITHDRLYELYGKCDKVKQIIAYYDLILTFQTQLELNNLSQYFLNQIKTFKSITNLISYYFTTIKVIMIELKVRDDLVLQNDHLHRTHLQTILLYAKKHQISN
ncbi:hypothetical protein crov324 [Cafeteria roenbergensis virus]|uniref:Uncharacterized protein n=1 Tax=Cafeteria roenbergensis virus (strain BV-PW1) TaxID=693272 RepID=E3T595_CROVB|nr:hypothetical protein crov324 [Cafeteria roenbergensis virus BV-PW1]ADO67358.1 hypothetical protein crov324 [Cafeteria roenbergensis virus BV-PW1]